MVSSFLRKPNLLVLAFLFIGLISWNAALSQERKKLSLIDIWASPTLSGKYVANLRWMNDGRYYTSLDAKGKSKFILKQEVKTGKTVDTLFNSSKNAGGLELDIDGYEFNSSEDFILLTTKTESIYRRSFTAKYYIFDRKNKTIFPLSAAGAQSYATFSPDGGKIAFVRGNNLWIYDLKTKAEIAVTTDGKTNEIINGSSDWVYEEEFEFAKGFTWSEDSKSIAFYRFDETNVPEYNMPIWGKLYPEDYKYKYPKAGEANSKVGIRVYDLETKATWKPELGEEKDQYIARLNSTKSAGVYSVRRMNRLQNHLELIHIDAKAKTLKVILEEKSETYVDINDDLTYLKNGKQFIFTSEKDGFKHAYLYDINGKLISRITSGNWEISGIQGIDEVANRLYYTSTEVSPLQRHFYSIKFDGTGKKKLTQENGTHKIDLAPDCSFFLDEFNTVNIPSVYSIAEGASGKVVKVLENNEGLKSKLESFAVPKVNFFKFKTEEGVELNGMEIKPTDFNPNKKYPVLMHVYGGPGNQQVLDQFGGRNAFWHYMLAHEGYVVVIVDNRGTGGRGAEFKKSTYARLGELEVKDQIETAKYLGKQAWVDKERIGIWGWSFGGYMTSLCLTVGADYFKAGIAVAPVTNWRYYDSIYTERYLKTPQLNPKGYDDNSPVTHAHKLKGKYLIIHGTGDDNVHLQNAVAMEEALIKANKQFQMFHYANRNHGIYGGVTRLHLFKQMTDFIVQNL